MPTIAIDYTPAYEQSGGIGRYVREMVAALARWDETTAYRLFVAGATARDLPTLPGRNFVWKPTPITPLWLARGWHRAHLPLPVELMMGHVDLFHATDFVLPPTRKQTRTLLTVHDLSFVRVPETASPALKAYLDAVVPDSVRRADSVLADSQATKDDLIALYNTPPDKIQVLLSGVDARFARVALRPDVQRRYGIPDRPYVFSCGTVQPRKNYARLIQAVSALRNKGHDLCLVIAGGHGWLEDPIYAMIDSTGMRDYVHMVGFADDADLPALYSAAACFALPSLYEGFGLPVLEAMACGTPVVTSNVSSLPEVAGDAALLVDPYDLDGLTEALARVLTDDDLRATLTARGYARVNQFTWDAAARNLKKIYSDLVGSES